MATVYVAAHTRLGHVVALKVLHSHYQKDEQVRSRFVEEARIQANLRHPHILTVHDIIELPDVSGMVMELLNGCSLSSFYRAEGVPLSHPRMLTLFTAVANALHHAHMEGVVHRDLKPSNIFLHCVHGEAVAKLMDFGVAKMRDGAVGDHNTATGTVLGTPHYMAPEQFEDSSTVDLRADIFSLGVMLYEASTGHLPFEGKSITSIMKVILTHTPTRPSELVPEFPPGLEHIITRCLQKHRELRFSRTSELEEELRQLADHTGYEPISEASVPKLTLYGQQVDPDTISTITGGGKTIIDVSDEVTEEMGKASTIMVPEREVDLNQLSWAGTQISQIKPPGTESRPGGSVLRNYRIKEKLYQGRETTVYRGVSIGIEKRPVIIKTLASNYPGPADIARLKHEYKLLRELELDGISQPVAFEKFKNGFALILEDIGGIDLRDYLQTNEVELADFLAMGGHLAELLARLHALNVVHKDINPNNIVINQDTGELQLVDFGLATYVSGQHEEALARVS